MVVSNQDSDAEVLFSRYTTPVNLELTTDYLTSLGTGNASNPVTNVGVNVGGGLTVSPSGWLGQDASGGITPQPPLNPCPALDQILMVYRKGENQIVARNGWMFTLRNIAPRLAADVGLTDLLYNPIADHFEQVIKADTVEDVEIWQAQSTSGAVTKGSACHPLIKSKRDKTGTPMNKIKGECLIWTPQRFRREKVSAQYIGRGAVRYISTEEAGTHLGLAGADVLWMFVWHNLKPNNPLE